MHTEKHKSKLIEMPERQTWRVDEFCSAYRISRATFYKLRAQGKITTIKIAGRTLVPNAEALRIAAGGTP